MTTNITPTPDAELEWARGAWHTLNIAAAMLRLEAEGHTLRGDKGKAEAVYGQVEIMARAIKEAPERIFNR